MLDAIQEGGIKIDLDPKDNDYELGQQIKRSALTFTAFKNHHNIVALVEALTDEKGNLRTWSQFKKVAKTIADDYNINWLAAEYRTSVKSVRMAKIWKRIEANAEKQPWLIYKTQNDDKVRNSHQLLHDVCKKVDDPFWDEFYPPNGWRCRCYTRQRRKFKGVAEPEAYPDEKQMPLAFRVNTGKSGELYSENHPYYQGLSKEHKQKVINASVKVSYRETLDFAKEHIKGNLFKLDGFKYMLSTRDIKTVLTKPHEERLLRNSLVLQLEQVNKDLEFIAEKSEEKGRFQYRAWRYYRLKSDKSTFIFNFALTPEGWRLHSISDRYKKTQD